MVSTQAVAVRRSLITAVPRVLVVSGLTAISVALVTGIGQLPPQIRSAVDKALALAGGAVAGGAGTGGVAAGDALSNGVAAGTETAEQALTGTLQQQMQYMEFIADGVERISFAFPFLFVIVTALVVYMTITRLVDTDRATMGCLKTLGYSTASIVKQYLPFTLLGTVVGSLAGLALGYWLVGPMLFNTVQDFGDMPSPDAVVPVLGMVTAAGIVLIMVAVTIVAALRTAREKPTTLLRGKAPQGASKSLIEHVAWVWNRLSFRYKSTLRNIFRFPVRLVMTVFSMMLSTVLVCAGLSLWFALDDTDPALMDTIRPISVLLVVAAIVLNALVIYNITNINIEERRREIATLKVLGYRDLEVAGYVFREILILTVMGIILGIPAGYGTMVFLFGYLQFGGVEYVEWWVWPLAGVLALASLGLANVLLYRKLVATDMNSSLKTVE
ncbi:MAG: ABC transporter permease [Cellulomonadaceae bacterium]|jgi:putative ABC transport system permease protein|nr:ABC transporter permease [Cellulomonadaceae bacterium]